MAWNLLINGLIIGTFAACVKNSGSAPNSLRDGDQKSKSVQEKRSCFAFPNDLAYESELVIGWSRRWKNQCPKGLMSTSLWAPLSNASIKDMKCCEGPVEQVLSEGLFRSDLESGGFNERWSLQCSGNYVLTGIKIVGNVRGGLHVAGIRCSAVLDKQVDYRSCKDVQFDKNNGKTRNPAVTWRQECLQNQGLVSLNGSNGFSPVTHGRCCMLSDVTALKRLPMSCSFEPNNACGWTLSTASTRIGRFPPTADGSMMMLEPGKSSGSASLTSPAYSFAKNQICFRLTYALILYAVLKLSIKSYRKADEVALIKEVKVLARNTGQFTDVDVLVDVSSNFQVIMEAHRLRGQLSNVMIKNVKFLNSDDCKVDQCTPPSGCGAHASCLPSGPHGLSKCTCNHGYERLNGKCVLKTFPTSALATPNNGNTLTASDGQHRGGDITLPIGTPRAKPRVLGTSSVQPWMYTVVGAICGTLLVVFLVLSFLTYRKRRLTRRTYQFNFDANYLRSTSLSGSLVSDNNNSYVMEPTSMQEVEMRCLDHDDLRIISNCDTMEDGASINTGTPPSHHYFEVEPEVDLERQTSQMTLISPVYGSSDDGNEQFGEKEVFLEPPNDEKELCAQLDREIDWRKLKILHEKQLGQGAFGYVHFGIWNRADGERKVVAIKSMKDSNSAEERIKFLQEAAIMKQFAHQNVVFMFGVVTKRYPPMIVLEYMKNGNLRKFLRGERKHRLNHNMKVVDRNMQKTFLKMAREIAAGMTYLSGMQFVHRDLAARNILLDDNMVCKIGDFGLARDLIGCNHYISQGGHIPVKWTSPEALSFRRYSSASDIWSFGVLLYEIWSVGRKPYEEWSNDEVIENVCNKGYRLPPPSDCPRVIYHLMIDCWHPEESNRPKFSQIKYCLAQRDERLLGRQHNVRQRSATLNEISCETIKEERYGELQYSYCKTD